MEFDFTIARPCVPRNPEMGRSRNSIEDRLNQLHAVNQMFPLALKWFIFGTVVTSISTLLLYRSATGNLGTRALALRGQVPMQGVMYTIISLLYNITINYFPNVCPHFQPTRKNNP